MEQHENPRLQAALDEARRLHAPPPRPGPAPSLELVIQPTDQLVQLDGVLCRVWQGVTDEGLPCLFFVHDVRGAQGQDSAAFDRAFQAQLPPGRVVALREVLEARDAP
jgi:hypothetical protein